MRLARLPNTTNLPSRVSTVVRPNDSRMCIHLQDRVQFSIFTVIMVLLLRFRYGGSFYRVHQESFGTAWDVFAG